MCFGPKMPGFVESVSSKINHKVSLVTIVQGTKHHVVVRAFRTEHHDVSSNDKPESHRRVHCLEYHLGVPVVIPADMSAVAARKNNSCS